MERWVVKLIATAIIFFVTFFATILPIKVIKYFEKQGRAGERFISYMMCFGGGVFLAIYMLHMSPDVQEIMNFSIIKPYKIVYPITELIIASGFFAMLFLEKIVQKFNKPSRKQVTNMAPIYTEVQPGGHMVKTNSFNQISKKDESEAHGHSHAVNIDTSSGLAITRSLVLLLALSLHHIFEGMTVGLKHSSRGVWNLVIAINAHEVVVGFSLGLQLLKAYSSKSRVLIAGFFCSLMTPIGVFIGMAIMELGQTAGNSPGLDATNGILQSIATGVFIYVTFFEILNGELTATDTSMSKIICVLFGFGLMALLGFTSTMRLYSISSLIPEETSVASRMAANALAYCPTIPTNCTCL